MNNYIYEYYQQIKDGRITVGKWILLLYEMIVHNLESKVYFFDQKEADRAIKFIERYIHHSEGPLAPQALRLELWQKALLSALFGIVDEHGVRYYRELFLQVARKNGKTLIASAIAGKCAYFDNEYGARVYFAAPKLEQSNLGFNAFYQSVKLEPKLDSRSKKRRTDIYIAETNSTVKPLAFSAGKSDGLNISCGICDEVASWAAAPGLKYYEVLKSSQGARKQPLLVSISTAGFVNDGIYDELMSRSTRVLLGDSGEKRLLPVLYMVDDPEKWNDINELRKSNPNIGVSVSVDYLLEEIAVAEGSLSRKTEFLTKICNIKQNASTAWLTSKAIEAACGDPIDLRQFENCYCVGGIDLSMAVDLTSACVVIEKDGVEHVFSHFWLPAEKLGDAIARDGIPYNIYMERGFLSLSGDNYIDYHDVFKWFVDLIEKYKIFPLKIGYDRYTAKYLVDELREYGFHMDDVFQGFNLSPVLIEVEGLINDKKINIGDNALFKVHLYNSAVKAESESMRLKLVKMSPKDHIDGVAAFVDAMTVKQKYNAEIGVQLQNKR